MSSKTLILISILLALLVVACNNSYEGSSLSKISNRDMTCLELRGKVENGYDWQYQVSPGGVVELAGRSTAACPANDNNGPIMGAPTATVFVFKSLKPGTAVVHFVYKHRFDATPHWVAKATLRVERNMDIKVVNFVADKH